MLAITVIVFPVFSAGFVSGRTPGRAVTEPVTLRGGGATPLRERTSLTRFGLSPGSVSASPRGLYRGQTAEHIAWRLRRLSARYRALAASSRKALRATVRAGYGNSWLERAFLCIHSHEGSWTDPNAPYWGGLQMDGDFMRHYGGWALKAFGTADRWPVSVQIAVAIQAKVSGRGFYPWPNTARACGLI